MSPSRPLHTVRIFGHDYTVEANAAARPRLDEAAAQLEQAMRACQVRQPDATSEQLIVLAALDLIHTAPRPALNEREISNGLAALQRKLDRLEAALISPEPPSSEPS